MAGPLKGGGEVPGRGHHLGDTQSTPATAGEQEPPSQPADQPAGGGATSDDTALAAVAYILTWLTGLIIFLVADKEDTYTRYHALQAIGFGVAVVIVSFLLQIIGFASPGILFPTFGLLGVAVIVAIILMAVKAYQGSKFRLPLIADIAEKNA